MADTTTRQPHQQRVARVRRRATAWLGRARACGGALLVLVALFILSSPASAAVATLKIAPSSGVSGATVVATGSGFPGRTAFAFTWDGAAADATAGHTRRNGTFSVSLVLPKLAAGNHALVVTAGAVSAGATVQFVSTSPTPTASPTRTPSPTAVPGSTPVVSPTATLAATGPMLGTCPVLPADNIWNTRVDGLPASTSSANFIASIGNGAGLHPDFGTVWNGAPNGIPFVVVDGSQPGAAVQFTYADESDPGPYPIPTNAPIEGGPASTGDRHVLVVDSNACQLYELYSAYPNADGSWNAGSGARTSLASNLLRPAGWTSADAAGLPILPGLVRYDEVAAGRIAHALRFTAAVTQKAYVWPARHFASSNTSTLVPPMGIRVRLKASVDISHFSPANQVILQALKTYGMLLADNGSNWYVSGAPDTRWNDSDLAVLHQIVGANLEVVDTASLMVDPNSGQAR